MIRDQRSFENERRGKEDIKFYETKRPASQLREALVDYSKLIFLLEPIESSVALAPTAT